METTKLVQAFEVELNLTEQGLLELAEKKKGLIIDVSTDEGFNLARKERTEQNKVLERIDRLAIDGKKSVDEARNSLKDRVSAIYAPNVTAFEAEDVRRKEEAARKKREEEERIQGIRNQINSIRQFATSLFGKSSEELQGIIEAVDMIDVSESFAELTQEALIVKQETLTELNQVLSSVIKNEQLEAEREALRREREAFEKERQQAESERIAQIKDKCDSPVCNNDPSKFKQGYHYQLVSCEGEESIVYFYFNPDANCLGFGFNIADGGGFLPERDLRSDSQVNEILITIK